jgi:acyl-CoA thioesterase I
MKLYWAALLGLVTLTACEGNSPTPPVKDEVSAAPEIPVIGEEQRILALGDSLFTGYGLEPGDSYPAKLEAALRAQGINARIVNAGVSGNTTADGLQRLAFTLNSQKAPPALVIISLGGNDMLRGLPVAQTRTNLDMILTELGKRKIPALLMGMLAPPNLGADYRREFDAIYPSLARKHRAALVPFFLQAVQGKPDLVQSDHIHPTARGIEEMVAGTATVVRGAIPAADGG